DGACQDGRARCVGPARGDTWLRRGFGRAGGYHEAAPKPENGHYQRRGSEPACEPNVPHHKPPVCTLPSLLLQTSGCSSSRIQARGHGSASRLTTQTPSNLSAARRSWGPSDVRPYPFKVVSYEVLLL